jgi:hypothetical protein
LAVAHPSRPHPFGYEPEPYHQPSYGPSYHPHPPPGYHQDPSYHQEPTYGHEHPKHNCSVEDVTEITEVCTPTFETACENVDLEVKAITDGEYCYDLARTVCSDSEEETEFEVCTYDYKQKYEDTTARTVEVSFNKESSVQMVTVCEPSYEHGYHKAYGQYCKEVEQETSVNVPEVKEKEVEVRVAYPEPVKTCVTKSIKIPTLSCEVVTEEKCVNQPQVQDTIVSVEKCTTSLGEPECHKVELTLPKQVCIELVYGYAHEPEPKYVEPKYPEPKYPSPQQ